MKDLVRTSRPWKTDECMVFVLLTMFLRLPNGKRTVGSKFHCPVMWIVVCCKGKLIEVGQLSTETDWC